MMAQDDRPHRFALAAEGGQRPLAVVGMELRCVALADRERTFRIQAETGTTSSPMS